MRETGTSGAHRDGHEQTEIRVKGHLNDRWAPWFEGFTIVLEENGETRLVGPVVDQAALYGLLKKVRDLGMPLISVILVEAEAGLEDISDTEQKKGERK